MWWVCESKDSRSERNRWREKEWSSYARKKEHDWFFTTHQALRSSNAASSSCLVFDGGSFQWDRSIVGVIFFLFALFVDGMVWIRTVELRCCWIKINNCLNMYIKIQHSINFNDTCPQKNSNVKRKTSSSTPITPWLFGCESLHNFTVSLDFKTLEFQHAQLVQSRIPRPHT